MCIAGDEAGIGLIDEYHRIGRDILHNTSYLLRGESVARGVVRRCQQQHAGVQAIGVLYHLVDIVGEGVVLFVQRVHLEGTSALCSHTVVVPPGELGDKYPLVVAHHQEVVDGILQHVLTTIGEQHLRLVDAIDLTQAHGDDALLALVIDAGIET